MKQLFAVSLLALAMPATGAGQAVRVPPPDVRDPDVRVHVQRLQGPGLERQPFEATVLTDRGSQIGVTVRDIDPGDADTQKASGGSGIVVEQVRPDSPAAAAGVHAADLIVSFDGERIRSARQFSRLVQETPPGRTVSATLVRDGRRSDVSITPAAPQSPGADGRQVDADRDVTIDSDRLRERIERELGQLDGLRRFDLPEFNFDFPGPSARGRLGVGVDDLTLQLASYFGAKEGVLVTTVTEDTPAARGGLKAGDVIVSFGGETVRNRVELQRAVGRAQPDAEVTIGVVRDRKTSESGEARAPSHPAAGVVGSAHAEHRPRRHENQEGHGPGAIS
jgi:membrane-associated protease RseP (regulator of RpoE activity)